MAHLVSLAGEASCMGMGLVIDRREIGPPPAYTLHEQGLHRAAGITSLQLEWHRDTWAWTERWINFEKGLFDMPWAIRGRSLPAMAACSR
jgi:hypothetical protein